MRYLDGDLRKPWPLYERLWEARRGAFVGLLMFALLLGLVIGVLVAVACFEHGTTGTNYGRSGLALLISLWELLVVVGAGTCYQMWMRELDAVERESETLEEILDRRLKAIERQVFFEGVPR
jgi:hypothetical protein